MEPTFEELLARARAGDEAALLDLARRYEPEVRAVARVRLGPALRPYLDTFDLVQSVHRSLLRGLRNNKFEFTEPGQLVALALTMVRHKVAHQWRKAKRQVRTGDPADSTASLPDLLLGMADDTPGPGAAVDARDAVDKLLSGLDDLDRRLLELSAQGYRTTEIAKDLGKDPDVLRVRMSRLRAKLRSCGVSDDWL
jgi:RNA polymerase sigma factor (sigma-70 family)